MNNVKQKIMRSPFTLVRSNWVNMPDFSAKKTPEQSLFRRFVCINPSIISPDSNLCQKFFQFKLYFTRVTDKGECCHGSIPDFSIYITASGDHAVFARIIPTTRAVRTITRQPSTGSSSPPSSSKADKS